MPKIFRCIHCRTSLRNPFHSLCLKCVEALRSAPPLCPQCADPRCLQTGENHCSRPWIRHSMIQSFHAGFTSLGQTHSILKSWKRMQGRYFTNSLIQEVSPQTWENLRNLRVDAVLSLPQHWKRSWKLNGNPSETLAAAMKKELVLPHWNPWELIHPSSGISAQAERGLEERLQKAARFRMKKAWTSPPLRSGLDPLRLLIVDDFLTSGRTLEEAALCLERAWGRISIHAFALGYRPRRDFQFEASGSKSA